MKAMRGTDSHLVISLDLALISEAYVLGAEHNEWDRAEKLLLKGREEFPGETALLNMLAQVVYVQEGRQGQARVYWDESLAVDPNQMEVHERLGLMLVGSDEGRAHLRRAAEQGLPTPDFLIPASSRGWFMRRLPALVAGLVFNPLG